MRHYETLYIGRINSAYVYDPIIKTKETSNIEPYNMILFQTLYFYLYMYNEHYQH